MRIFIVLLLSLAAASAETLRWELDGNLEWLGGYRLYWGSQGQKIALDVGKVHEFNIDNILKDAPPGITVFFEVSAYNTDDVEGKPSNEVSYRKPTVPTPTPTPLPTPAPTPAPLPPHTHTWDEITGKPSVFPNEPHTHVVPATESSE